LALVAKVSGIPAQIKAGAHTVTATFIERSWALSNDPTGSFGSGKVSGMPIIRDGLQVVDCRQNAQMKVRSRQFYRGAKEPSAQQN
jgi:hypothetical protein